MADLSEEGRDKAASKGQALPDGSFPIVTVADLKNAIQAIGRAKNYEKAKAHIIKRARALKRVDLLPDDWEIALTASGGYYGRALRSGSFKKPVSGSYRKGAQSGSTRGGGGKRRVASDAGARRYGKPIGSQLGGGGEEKQKKQRKGGAGVEPIGKGRHKGDEPTSGDFKKRHKGKDEPTSTSSGSSARTSSRSGSSARTSSSGKSSRSSSTFSEAKKASAKVIPTEGGVSAKIEGLRQQLQQEGLSAEETKWLKSVIKQYEDLLALLGDKPIGLSAPLERDDLIILAGCSLDPQEEITRILKAYT